MGFLDGLITSVKTLFANLYTQPNWRDFLDILIIAILIYEVLRLVIRTRSGTVLRGMLMLAVLAWLTDVLQLNVVSWLMRQLLNTGVVVMVILFQPEIRSALEQLGRSAHVSSQQNHASTAAQRNVAEMTQAITNMSKKRIGALIVFEKRTGLNEFVETGTYVNADISQALVENIFEPNTPLHDGAAIIRGGRIIACACILTLSNDPDISRELGTRHRAAIGVTETTDATAIVVSEETGVISYARGGKIQRYLDARSLNALLNELLDAGGNGAAGHRFRLATVFKNSQRGDAD